MTVWEALKPRRIFTAEDIRQYAYCKRKPYFRYVLRKGFKPSVKMVRGDRIHQETCRAKRVERNGEISRYYNVYLRSETLGLAAVIDYFEYDGKEIILVDVKTGSSKEIHLGYYLQMAAYALLVEVCLDVPIRRVLIRYEDEKVERELEFGVAAKLAVLRALREMREMVETEVIPPPARNPRKCTDCEAWRICRRV